MLSFDTSKIENDTVACHSKNVAPMHSLIKRASDVGVHATDPPQKLSDFVAVYFIDTLRAQAHCFWITFANAIEIT